MSRSFSCTGLCLRVKPSGESNREAWFLSAQDGIFRATVFGGPKSRLRSQVSPFHQGRVWIYHDPVRDSRKVTDFDVETWRPGLRELYERAMAAGALSETVLATHGGGGGWDTALEIASKTLDELETGDEKDCAPILVRFLWNWTGFLGIRPDLNHCNSCACEIPPDKLIWYDRLEGNSAFHGNGAFPWNATPEGNIYCEKCRPSRAAALESGPRRWLLEDGRIDTDRQSLRQSGTFVLGILTGAVGKRLSLWDAIF